MKMDFSKIKSKGKKSDKPSVSPEHVKLIQDALAKHEGKKPHIHVSVTTDSTHEDSDSDKKRAIDTEEDW